MSKQYTVKMEYAPLPPEVIDFEGVRLEITNPTLTFIMRAFRLMGKLEQAIREMYPYLKSEKNAYLAHIEKQRAMITANNHRSQKTAQMGA